MAHLCSYCFVVSWQQYGRRQQANPRITSPTWESCPGQLDPSGLSYNLTSIANGKLGRSAPLIVWSAPSYRATEWPKPSGGSISPLEKHAEFLLGLIAEQPDMTLDEVVAAMRKRRIAVWRKASIALDHAVLHLDCAAHSINDAAELANRMHIQVNEATYWRLRAH